MSLRPLLAAFLLATAAAVARGEGAKPPGADPVPLARQWAMATTAVLTEYNGHRHDLLGLAEPLPSAVEVSRWILDRWWGVRDRAGLLKMFRWLDEEGGHRAGFEKLAKSLPEAAGAEEASLDAEARFQRSIVRRFRGQLGKKGLLGWDYIRLINLCRWGYAVGFLTEDEAWSRMMPISRRLQEAFDSWADLGMNYLIGDAYWSGEDSTGAGNVYRVIYDRLVSDPGSPWARIPWKTSLDKADPPPPAPAVAPGVDREVDALVARAAERRKALDFEGATAALTEALRKRADRPDLFVARGAIRKDLDDWRGASSDFNNAVRLDPTDAAAWGWVALMDCDHGYDELAHVHADRALGIDPKDGVALTVRGNLRVQGGALAEGLRDLDEAIRLRPDLLAAYVARAYAHISLQKNEEAAKDAEQALRLVPRSLPARAVSAKVCQARGDLKQAEAELDAALEGRPTHPGIWIFRAEVRYALGNLDGALADADEALRQDETRARPLELRACVHLRKGDAKSAMADTARWVELEPGRPDAYALRCEARALSGDLKGAISDLRRALQLAPTDWDRRKEVEDRLKALEAQQGGR